MAGHCSYLAEECIRIVEPVRSPAIDSLRLGLRAQWGRPLCGTARTTGKLWALPPVLRAGGLLDAPDRPRATPPSTALEAYVERTAAANVVAVVVVFVVVAVAVVH